MNTPRITLLLLALAGLGGGLLAQDAQPDADADNPAEPKEEVVNPRLQPMQEFNQDEVPAEKLQTETVKNADGLVIRQFTCYLDEHGRKVKHGAYTEFYDSGQKKRQSDYVHGYLHGLQVWYHPNGQVRWRFQAKANKRHGLFQEFFRNGRLKYAVRYEDGRKVKTTERRPVKQ